MYSPRRSSGPWIRCCLVTFAVASALCVSAPALYWRFKKGGFFGDKTQTSSSSATCPSCVCDCPAPLSLQNIAPGLVNLSITGTTLCDEFRLSPKLHQRASRYCGKHDPELNKEMEKQFVDLLTEELKLQEAIAEEHSHHMNITLVEAKRLASQYQQESEKCNAATETCEEAREQAEAALRKEKRATHMWEQRARHHGWQDAS